MIVLYPEQLTDIQYEKGKQEYRNHMKFVTGSADGRVKIWPYGRAECEQTLEVACKDKEHEWMVLAITFMSYSRRLVVATADRKISFYEITNGQKFSVNTVSKIENLLAIPLCLEYYRWEQPSYIDEDQLAQCQTREKNGDKKENEKESREKKETLLVGDDLGTITKYDFTEKDWHYCHYNQKQPNYCCNAIIEKEYQLQLEESFQESEKEKANRNKNIQKQTKAHQKGEATEPKKEQAKSKPKPLERQIQKKHVYQKTRYCHKGWITRIKYYSDLNYVVSASLDGLIHIHDIERLTYKSKTFNLHQKGINSFVYSKKNKLIASCGEERYIIMWDPFTLGILTHLNGHNTSVTDLAINEDRNHLISLGTNKLVNIWDIRTYTLI